MFFFSHPQWNCQHYGYYHWCVELFEFLLNCSALSSSVSSAPPPSEPGRRWLRSHPQQQVLCFQDCQQRQFLSLPYQRQESHIQRSGGFTPKSWYWPRPQQISDPAGNFFSFFFFFFLFCLPLLTLLIFILAVTIPFCQRFPALRSLLISQSSLSQMFHG